MMAGVPQPWLTRNVRVLSAVSFLQDTASELLYPLLPDLPDDGARGAAPPSSAPSRVRPRARRR